MLKQRILTAIPLALVVGWLIFFQPTSVFFYFLLFIAVVAGYEWAKLSGVGNMAARLTFSVLITVLIYLFDRLLPAHTIWSVYVAALWWLSITFYLKTAVPSQPSGRFRADKLLVSLIVLPAAVFAMRDIHQLHQGAQWLFYAMSLVWVADIGAYFSGKRFGRRKLSPNISPGKTREGLIGARQHAGGGQHGTQPIDDLGLGPQRTLVRNSGHGLQPPSVMIGPLASVSKARQGATESDAHSVWVVRGQSGRARRPHRLRRPAHRAHDEPVFARGLIGPAA